MPNDKTGYIFTPKQKEEFNKLFAICSNKHITFGKASSEVNCANCNYRLTKSKGGKAKLRARVEEILCN